MICLVKACYELRKNNVSNKVKKPLQEKDSQSRRTIHPQKHQSHGQSHHRHTNADSPTSHNKTTESPITGPPVQTQPKNEIIID